MPSKPWAVPTGHEAKSSCRGADRSVQKALSYPRVPLVPRCTRGYFLATTPWFVVEGSAGGGVDQGLEGFLVKALRFLANEVSGVCVQKGVNRRDAFKDFSFVREEFAARANFFGQGVDGRFQNGSRILGNSVGPVGRRTLSFAEFGQSGKRHKGAGCQRFGDAVGAGAWASFRAFWTQVAFILPRI